MPYTAFFYKYIGLYSASSKGYVFECINSLRIGTPKAFILEIMPMVPTYAYVNQVNGVYTDEMMKYVRIGNLGKI